MRNSRGFKLCLSIFAHDLPTLKLKLRTARKHRPDLVELRLDYLAKIDEYCLREVEKLASDETILTLRSRAEGGKSYLRERERVSILEKLASFPKCYTDIEINTFEKNPDLMKAFEDSEIKIIASFHDFSKTPSERELESLINRAANSVYATKVACYANSFDDNRRLLSLYESSVMRKARPRKLVAFCMGEYGVFSRFASLYSGAPFTYASLPGKATAPGQLDIEIMRAALGQLRRS
ncbi:MAG: type I 3-dehydroquinate dehydratase [Nitrososphaerota archaeon]|nr:type I 3-dehydroquinate dehydratase [Nitrososphaerota archaeon]